MMGFLGLDCLIKNSAGIECKTGKLKFRTILGEEVITTGTRGESKATPSNGY